MCVTNHDVSGSFSLVAVLLELWLSDNTLEKKVEFLAIPCSWTLATKGRRDEDVCSEVGFNLWGEALKCSVCLSGLTVFWMVLLGHGLGLLG